MLDTVDTPESPAGRTAVAAARGTMWIISERDPPLVVTANRAACGSSMFAEPDLRIRHRSGSFKRRAAYGWRILKELLRWVVGGSGGVELQFR
jgi:hypothetical protein